MRKRFIIDSDCPVLQSMKWTPDRKNNINEMYKAVQDRYKVVSGEVGVVFSTTKSDKSPHGLLYNIDGAREIPNIYREGEWYPDAEDTIRFHLSMAGVSVPMGTIKQDFRLCPWHNHHHGTEFSTPDMILLVDFFPYIHESYLDVECVQRLTPSNELKSNLKDEVYKSEFLCLLHKLRKESYKEFESALDDLDGLHMDALNTYGEAKYAAIVKGEELDCSEFEPARKSYVDGIEKLNEKFQEYKEYKEAKAKFIIFRYGKKEIED